LFCIYFADILGIYFFICESPGLAFIHFQWIGGLVLVAYDFFDYFLVDLSSILFLSYSELRFVNF